MTRGQNNFYIFYNEVMLMFSHSDAAPAIQKKAFQIDDVTITIVCNTLEATKFVYFDGLSSEKDTDALYEKIINKIEEEAGKYYLVLPEDSRFASYIRKNQPSQLPKIVGANPLATKLVNADNFQKLDPQNFQCQTYLDESKNSSLSILAGKISAFQTQSLCDIRDDLSDDVAKKKIEERYQAKMIEKKLKSNSIAIFVAEDSNGVAATLVVTSFPKDEKSSESSKNLYASDLILRKSLIENQKFISQFMGHVYHLLPSTFAKASVVTLLAPGQKLGKCITETTQKDGTSLCEKLTASNQDKQGLLTYFVAPKTPAVTNGVEIAGFGSKLRSGTVRMWSFATGTERGFSSLSLEETPPTSNSVRRP